MECLLHSNCLINTFFFNKKMHKYNNVDSVPSDETPSLPGPRAGHLEISEWQRERERESNQAVPGRCALHTAY